MAVANWQLSPNRDESLCTSLHNSTRSVLYYKLFDLHIIHITIYVKCDSHWTNMSTFLLSFPQGFFAVQIYCPAIVLLMLCSDKILPFPVTTFDTSTQEIFGEGRPNPLQTRSTSWPSLTTVLLLSMVADAETAKEKHVFAREHVQISASGADFFRFCLQSVPTETESATGQTSSSGQLTELIKSWLCWATFMWTKAKRECLSFQCTNRLGKTNCLSPYCILSL